MSASETEPPFGKRPRDWVLAWRIGVAVLAAVAASGGAVLLFAGKAYIKEAAVEQLAPVAELPGRVTILEADRLRQDRDQRTTAAAVSSIQQDVAAIKARQDEASRNVEANVGRILKRLDDMADRR